MHKRLLLIGVLVLGFSLLVGAKKLHPATSQPTPLPTASPSPAPTPNPQVTLIFGGDIMLGRTVETRIKSFGGEWPLKTVGPTMAAADITVANLESPFRQDAASTVSGSLVLRGDPDGLSSLTEAGIDLVSLANNHIPDMGLSGLQQTEKLLDNAGIKHAGAGESEPQAAQPAIITSHGQRFGFLSYTYGVNFDSPGVYYNLTDPAQAARDVAALKPQVDMVVVLVHFGTEYQTVENITQETFAHAAIDAGASLVVGGHPHVDQPMEPYKGGLIFYSLGNLVFDQTPGEGRDYSSLVSVTTDGAKLKSVSLLPYRIFNYGQPQFLTSESDKASVWDRFKVPGGTVALSTN